MATYTLKYRVQGRWLGYGDVSTSLFEPQVIPVLLKLSQFPYVSILSLTED